MDTDVDVIYCSILCNFVSITAYNFITILYVKHFTQYFIIQYTSCNIKVNLIILMFYASLPEKS